MWDHWLVLVEQYYTHCNFCIPGLNVLLVCIKYKIGAFSTTRLERSPQQRCSLSYLWQLSFFFWKTLTWSHYFIKRGSLWNAMKLVSPATFWSSYPNYPNKSELSFICVRCFEFVSVSMIFRLYFGTVLSDDAVFFCFSFL